MRIGNFDVMKLEIVHPADSGPSYVIVTIGSEAGVLTSFRCAPGNQPAVGSVITVSWE